MIAENLFELHEHNFFQKHVQSNVSIINVVIVPLDTTVIIMSALMTSDYKLMTSQRWLNSNLIGAPVRLVESNYCHSEDTPFTL